MRSLWYDVIVGISTRPLRSLMVRSISSPTRRTKSRSLPLSASTIKGSASIWPSVLLSGSAGDRLGAGAGKREGSWPSETGREDKTVGIVNGSAWGERVVVREERREVSSESEDEEEEGFEERTIAGTVRVDVSVGEREREK